MSHLCRLVSRSTSNMIHVSRMQVHNLAPGTAVKVPEAKSGYHIVSGSGQFIATDGPNANVRSGIGGGSSASMIPGAQSNFDSTHHTKSTSENKQSQS